MHTDKWKAQNRELNRQLERERKQRAAAAIDELRTYLPRTYIVDILNRLKVKTCTTDLATCRFPQHLILEAVVEYVSELQLLHEMKNNTQYVNVEVQTELDQRRSVHSQTTHHQSSNATVQTSAECCSISIQTDSDKKPVTANQVQQSSSGSFNINDIIGNDLGSFGNELTLPPPPPPPPSQPQRSSNQRSSKNTNQSFSRPWKQSIDGQTTPAHNMTTNVKRPMKRKLSATSHSIEKLAEKVKPAAKSSSFHSIPLPEPKLALVGQSRASKQSKQNKTTPKPQIWSHVTDTTQNDQFFQTEQSNLFPFPSTTTNSSSGNKNQLPSNTLDFSIDSLFGGGADDFLFSNQPTNKMDDYLQRNSWNDNNWYPYPLQSSSESTIGFYQNAPMFDPNYNLFQQPQQQPQTQQQQQQQFPHNIKHILQTQTDQS